MKTLSNILLILFSPSLFGQPELWKAYSNASSGLPETKLKGQYHFYYNTKHLSNRTYFSQFQADKCKQTQKLW